MNNAAGCAFSGELSADERQILFGWDSDPFRSRIYGLSWRPKNHHILCYSGDRLTSHVGLVRETVGVGGTSLSIGGIGDVITVPEFQGRGFAQKAIEEAVKVIVEEWHLKYGLLFCLPPLQSFYERLGWTARKELVSVSQPNGRIALPICSMVCSWGGEEWPPGEIELSGLPW